MKLKLFLKCAVSLEYIHTHTHTPLQPCFLSKAHELFKCSDDFKRYMAVYCMCFKKKTLFDQKKKINEYRKTALKSAKL